MNPIAILAFLMGITSPSTEPDRSTPTVVQDKPSQPADTAPPTKGGAKAKAAGGGGWDLN